MHDAVRVEAKNAGDRAGDLFRQCDGAGASAEFAERGVSIVEQLDAEGSADIGGGAGQSKPRRGALVAGYDQVMIGGKLFDLFDSSRIRAVFGAQLLPCQVFTLAGPLVTNRAAVLAGERRSSARSIC
jgi:hypothetical protein